MHARRPRPWPTRVGAGRIAPQDVLRDPPHVHFAGGEQGYALEAGRDPLRYVGGWLGEVTDIILYCALDFGRGVGQPIDPSLKNLTAWFERVSQRAPAKASLHPASEGFGAAG
jgi:glutathione S-transferase